MNVSPTCPGIMGHCDLRRERSSTFASARKELWEGIKYKEVIKPVIEEYRRTNTRRCFVFPQSFDLGLYVSSISVTISASVQAQYRATDGYYGGLLGHLLLRKFTVSV